MQAAHEPTLYDFMREAIEQAVGVAVKQAVVEARAEPVRKLLSANDLQEMGLSSAQTYELLNRRDMPVVQIGKRKYMDAEMFDEWRRNKARSWMEGED